MAVTTSIPRIFTDKEVGEILGRSTEALSKDRANGTGPQWLKIEGSVRYLESDLIAYLESCKQGPAPDGSKAATPAAITAAMMEGSAQRRAANAARTKQLQDLDAADRIPDSEKVIDGVTPITLGFAGQAPGIARCDPLTGKPIGAQTTVTNLQTGRADVTVAVAPAQNGAVPVPWQK